jgi:hypothetical protein
MERINAFEIARKIGYWQHMLSKIEMDMSKMQSERVEIRNRLVHLHLLQKQQELVV